MTDDEKTELKAKIISEIERISKDIDARKSADDSLEPDVAIGRLTRMDAIGNKSVKDATLVTLKNTLSRLKSALNRIDEDEFGLCIVCEEEIPYKRLLLVPGATRCVACSG
jgi:DnaK suppressor protein